MTVDEQTLNRVVAFHGHLCPGLAMGMQAAAIALREIGPHAEDEEVVAIIETDMCGADAIQFLTGCTFGKGNLIHRDWGKNAYTFFRRSDGRALRIVGRPEAWQRDPDDDELFARVREGRASEEDQIRLARLRDDRSRRILHQPPDELFDIQEVADDPPAKARIHSSVVCAECGEATMETRVRRFEGRQLCLPCFETATTGS